LNRCPLLRAAAYCHLPNEAWLAEVLMGRGILLWLLGVPIPVILLLALCSHH